MESCVFYDKRTRRIKGFWPSNMDEHLKTQVRLMWSQDIPRKILIALSESDDITTPQLQEKIGHSMSTLHENLRKLEQTGLIRTEMSYVKNKKKVLKSLVLCVTQNPTMTSKVKSFLNKGLWVDSKKSKKIVDFLDANPDDFFSVPEIASKTKIPADEVETLLNNWDSQVTRAFSDFLKPVPFEKKVLYRSRK